MKYFRPLVEEKDSNIFGFSVYGEALTVQLKQAQYTDLMELTFSGTRTLSKIKSLENIKQEYNEKDHNKLESIYKNLTKKYSTQVEKLVKQFEKDLNKVVIDFEKDTQNF